MTRFLTTQDRESWLIDHSEDVQMIFLLFFVCVSDLRGHENFEVKRVVGVQKKKKNLQNTQKLRKKEKKKNKECHAGKVPEDKA